MTGLMLNGIIRRTKNNSMKYGRKYYASHKDYFKDYRKKHKKDLKPRVGIQVIEKDNHIFIVEKENP